MSVHRKLHTFLLQGAKSSKIPAKSIHLPNADKVVNIKSPGEGAGVYLK